MMRNPLLLSILTTVTLAAQTAQRSDARELILAGVLESNPVTAGFRARPSQEILRDRTGAHFLAVFIVDTLGRTEVNTVRFVREAPMAYRRQVCAELGQVRFRPIHRAETVRRAVVVRPFDFWPAHDTAFHVTAGARFDSVRAAIVAKGATKALQELATAPSC